LIGRVLKVEGPWVAYCAIIVFLSSRTGRQLQWVTLPDVITHFIEFGILGILSYRVFRCWTTLTGFSALIFCALFGVLDEVHQWFVPQRSFEIKDMIVDSLGAFTGIVIARAVIQRKESRNGTDARHS
jgi:VanZ family protein